MKMKNALKVILLILVNPVLGEDTIAPRIDTHIHLYDTQREGSSTFLDPVIHEKIYFPHFAETFVDTAGPAGVNYAVVVEASQRREDNFWLMQHVDTSTALVAFIANLDPRDPFYIADLDSLSSYEKFRGIRIRPSTSINIADAGVMASFAHLARKNLVLELGGNGVDPATISDIARRFPNMNIIMNHLAGIQMQGDQVVPGDYQTRLAEFAREPNVYCKISALYTLIHQDPAPTSPEAYKPLIDPVIDAFGPERVIFGSNWTLSDMHGSYGDMIKMLDLYLEDRDDLTEEQFYYENINRAYGINLEEPVYTGAGNGLFRSFWNGAAGGRGWFEDSICGEIVPCVDMYWPEGSPACELNSTYWNARWTGTIEAMFSETYTFFLTVNDYARMWINGEQVMDAWSGAVSHSTLTAEVNLLAGEQVSIQIDFANLYADAFITLEWQSASNPKGTVPQKQLYAPALTGTDDRGITGGAIQVFPNPANHSVTIINPYSPLGQISLIDVSGRVIHEQVVSDQRLELETSDWEQGLYFVRSMNDQGTTSSQLMIE
jgi:predicted TIM-barrel fold metal-dependent hydrolase